MAKQPGRKVSMRAYQLPPYEVKRFRPISWRGRYSRAVDYISHILMELGRLGLAISDIQSYGRPPNTMTVLSDLIEWLDDPGEAFARLIDWKKLDFKEIRPRFDRDRSAKPRIELSAHISNMNNLSVRWHPSGWRHTYFDWDRANYDERNLVTHRKWSQRPDFWWFTGDEQPTFDSRPSNELMYIRGVGNLSPEPYDSYGPYSKYNADVVDSLLISAVRAAYEGLIEQLERSFEVTVVDAFDFQVREEAEDDAGPYPVHRVVAWSLEDAAELQSRRDRDAAVEQERRGRSDLAHLSDKYGFTLEDFVQALLQAISKKASGPAPSAHNIDQNAAKHLRKNGHAIDAGEVRHIRRLIELYDPERLPEHLREKQPHPSGNKIQ